MLSEERNRPNFKKERVGRLHAYCEWRQCRPEIELHGLSRLPAPNQKAPSLSGERSFILQDLNGSKPVGTYTLTSDLIHAFVIHITQ